MVQNIKENEVVQRNELEKLGLTTSERLPLNKRRKSRVAHDDDSDYECEICRANLFLSLVCFKIIFIACFYPLITATVKLLNAVGIKNYFLMQIKMKIH